jgi:hypothetical protein
VLDGAVPMTHKRTSHYTEVQDATMIKAWESVSLDAVTGTYSTSNRYSQQIDGKFFQFMPRLASTPPHTYRSLQGSWDVM